MLNSSVAVSKMYFKKIGLLHHKYEVLGPMKKIVKILGPWIIYYTKNARFLMIWHILVK